MCHASTPRALHVSLFSDFVCNNTFSSGGDGVPLKSDFPFRDAYANSKGFLLGDLMKMRVIWAWGIIQSHSFAVNLVSQIHNPVIK